MLFRSLSNGTFVKVGGDATRTEMDNGKDGVINTGSGGGSGKGGLGGNGSSGVVIIRFKNIQANSSSINIGGSSGGGIINTSGTIMGTIWNNYMYPILSSNPIIWLKFDDNTNLSLDTMNNATFSTLENVTNPSFDSTNKVKGSEIGRAHV